MSIHSSKIYRPINEVDSSTIDLRSIWWNPTPLKKLPSLKILGGVVVAIFMLLAVFLPVGLIAAIGAGVYFYNLKKFNNTFLKKFFKSLFLNFYYFSLISLRYR